VLSCIGLLVTGEIAGEAMMWHFRLGFLVLSLLTFRLVWGFIGGYWSRFSTFVVGPKTILHYALARPQPEHGVGHNPLGSLSVLGLLVFSFLQGVAGLFSDDEIATAGPLSTKVASDWVHLASQYHTEVGKGVLIALVVLHIGAIVFYRVRKGVDLVSPMLCGDKVLARPAQASRDDVTSRALALGVFVLCACAIAWLVGHNP
jgi:cytochrome b